MKRNYDSNKMKQSQDNFVALALSVHNDFSIMVPVVTYFLLILIDARF